MRGITRILLITLTAITLCGVAQRADATTMIYRSVDELYEMSHAVVRGTVTDSRTFWSDEGTLFTDWTFQVDEVLSGQAPTQVTIRQMGGEIDDVRMEIPGDGRFRIGDHLVVFLRAEDGVHYLTLMGQAVMSVSLQGGLGIPGDAQDWSDTVGVSPVDATVVRNLSDMTFYQNGEDGPQMYRVEDSEVMTLESLRALGVEGGGQ